MITREEVIAMADECVFDIVEPDEYHDKREIADSGNLWITERLERFAQAFYQKGVEDALDEVPLTAEEEFQTATKIRKLLEAKV